MRKRTHMDIAVNGSSYRGNGRSRTTARSRSRGRRLYATERPTSSGRSGLSALELGVILALVLAVILAALLSAKLSSPPRTATTAIHVGTGDSLWSIARAHPVSGLTVQQTVDLIKQRNHLNGNTIAVGDVLQVPVPAAERSAVALAR